MTQPPDADYPVDSTYLPCCHSIGDHASDCDPPPLLKHMTEQPKGDRYDRLAKSVAILADDDNLKAGEPPYNAEGLQAFAAGLTEKRLLDDLTEADADTVAMLSLLDYTAGLQKMAWRISDICSEEPTLKWEYHNEIAVVRRLAYILYLFLGAIQGAFDEDAVTEDEVL